MVKATPLTSSSQAHRSTAGWRSPARIDPPQALELGVVQCHTAGLAGRLAGDVLDGSSRTVATCG